MASSEFSVLFNGINVLTAFASNLQIVLVFVPRLEEFYILLLNYFLCLCVLSNANSSEHTISITATLGPCHIVF